MKFKVIALFVALLVTACATQTQVIPPVQEPTPEPEPLAVLTSLSGTVTIDDRQATQGDRLEAGNTIVTGPNSLAVVTFLAGSVLRLDEKSEIVIGTLEKEDVTLTQLSGSSYSRLTPEGKPDSYTIETPYTVATVRGTAFSVTVDESQASVAVADGTVTTNTDDVIGTLETGDENVATAEEIVTRPATITKWLERNIGEDETLLERLAEKRLARQKKAAEGLGITQDELKEWTKDYLAGRVKEEMPPRERIAALKTENAERRQAAAERLKQIVERKQAEQREKRVLRKQRVEAADALLREAVAARRIDIAEAKEKLRQMTPAERRAFLQKLRQQQIIRERRLLEERLATVAPKETVRTNATTTER